MERKKLINKKLGTANHIQSINNDLMVHFLFNTQFTYYIIVAYIQRLVRLFNILKFKNIVKQEKTSNIDKNYIFFTNYVY